MINKGMSPDEFDNANFHRMQEILQARDPDERPEDPMEMLKRLGITPGNM